jgi:mRNA interferase RelE/StbE
MASYKLLFKKSVAQDLRNFPKGDSKKILEQISALASDTRGPGSKKLSVQEYYRVRQGAYRIIYEIVDHQLVVQVIRVGHRSKV